LVTNQRGVSTKDHRSVKKVKQTAVADHPGMFPILDNEETVSRVTSACHSERSPQSEESLRGLSPVLRFGVAVSVARARGYVWPTSGIVLFAEPGDNFQAGERQLKEENKGLPVLKWERPILSRLCREANLPKRSQKAKHSVFWTLKASEETPSRSKNTTPSSSDHNLLNKMGKVLSFAT